ncbi:MAG TPA: PAS domain S-box protein, partial [Desulfosalsimonadaceae bacterium]|nr:PAS domain S-box protein [Desulfosalsimonadaceae bacterium]
MTDSKAQEDLQKRITELEAQVENCRAEIQTLQQSARTYRLLVENVPDLIWIMSTEKFKLHYLSPSVEQMLGYTLEESLKKPFYEIITPESFEYAARYFAEENRRLKEKNAATEKIHKLELEYFRKDGSTVWVEVTARPILD